MACPQKANELSGMGRCIANGCPDCPMNRAIRVSLLSVVSLALVGVVAAQQARAKPLVRQMRSALLDMDCNLKSAPPVVAAIEAFAAIDNAKAVNALLGRPRRVGMCVASNCARRCGR